MKLRIMEIPGGGMDLEARASGEKWFRDVVNEVFKEDFRKGDPATLILHLFKSCDNISIAGSSEIALSPSCHRCLGRFKLPLKIPLRVDLAAPARGTPLATARKGRQAPARGTPLATARKGRQAPAPEKGHGGVEDIDMEAEDMNFAFYKGEEIDVSDILREMLLLEIPLRYLCSESCKGLCPQCGKNLNLDTCPCATHSSSHPFSALKNLLKS